jgi:nitronate monooxygenase
MGLGLRPPIVQAPMAGGPSTVEPAAAVSEAGGVGFLAAGYEDPSAVREELRAVRALTGQRIGVDVFVPGPPGDRCRRLTRAARPARAGRRPGCGG